MQSTDKHHKATTQTTQWIYISRISLQLPANYPLIVSQKKKGNYSSSAFNGHKTINHPKIAIPTSLQPQHKDYKQIIPQAMQSLISLQVH